MQIDWWTLGLQAINFLILVWLLSRFLYRPVRDVIATRKAEADRALSDAKEREAAAEEARTKSEAERADLAQARRDLEAQVHKEVRAEAETIVDAGRKQAAEIIETAIQAAKDEQARALETTKREVAALAVTLAAGLLVRQGDHGSGASAIAAVGAFLDGLTDDRRDELRRDAATADEPVQVCTAEALSDAGRSAWTEAVRGWFGDGVGAAFATDPDLLGGAILRLPHAELDLSWARQLGDAEAHIVEAGR